MNPQALSQKSHLCGLQRKTDKDGPNPGQPCLSPGKQGSWRGDSSRTKTEKQGREPSQKSRCPVL